MQHASVTGALTDFLLSSRWEDVPDDVRHAARRSILNFFGTALGGSRDAAIAGTLAVLDRFSGAREASVIGRRDRLDMLSAAFINAASGNVLDFDDTHHPTIIHPTAPVAPALFALAESQPMSGAALLHAFVLGVEVECRLGNAVIAVALPARLAHHVDLRGVRRGRGRRQVLAFDAEHIIWALGNASAQSSGLVETSAPWRRASASAPRRAAGCGRAVRAGRRHRPGRADRRAARLHRGDGRSADLARDHRRAGRDLGAAGEHPQALSVRRRAVSGDRRLSRAARAPCRTASDAIAASWSSGIRCCASAPTGPGQHRPRSAGQRAAQRRGGA